VYEASRKIVIMAQLWLTSFLQKNEENFQLSHIWCIRGLFTCCSLLHNLFCFVYVQAIMLPHLMWKTIKFYRSIHGHSLCWLSRLS